MPSDKTPDKTAGKDTDTDKTADTNAKKDTERDTAKDTDKDSAHDTEKATDKAGSGDARAQGDGEDTDKTRDVKKDAGTDKARSGHVSAVLRAGQEQKGEGGGKPGEAGGGKPGGGAESKDVGSIGSAKDVGAIDAGGGKPEGGSDAPQGAVSEGNALGAIVPDAKDVGAVGSAVPEAGPHPESTRGNGEEVRNLPEQPPAGEAAQVMDPGRNGGKDGDVAALGPASGEVKPRHGLSLS